MEERRAGDWSLSDLWRRRGRRSSELGHCSIWTWPSKGLLLGWGRSLFYPVLALTMLHSWSRKYCVSVARSVRLHRFTVTDPRTLINPTVKPRHSWHDSDVGIAMRSSWLRKARQILLGFSQWRTMQLTDSAHFIRSFLCCAHSVHSNRQCCKIFNKYVGLKRSRDETLILVLLIEVHDPPKTAWQMPSGVREVYSDYNICGSKCTGTKNQDNLWVHIA